VRRYRLLYSTKRLNRPPNVDLHGYLPVEAMSDDGEFVQESDQTGGKSFPGLRDAHPFRRRSHYGVSSLAFVSHVRDYE